MTEPLPGNRVAWRAFTLVEDCRAAAGMGLGSFDWPRVGYVLGLYSITMTARLHRQLAAMVDEVMIVQQKQARERADKGRK